jgi:hypothetical protein
VPRNPSALFPAKRIVGSRKQWPSPPHMIRSSRLPPCGRCERLRLSPHRKAYPNPSLQSVHCAYLQTRRVEAAYSMTP